MGSNAEQFARGLAQEAAKLPVTELVRLHRRIVLEALRLIVDKTPVRRPQLNADGSPRANQILGGRARGGWHVTIGSPATEETRTEDHISQALDALATLQPYTTVYISNNVFYIIYLEEGSSSQAPQGMVSVSVEELITIFP